MICTPIKGPTLAEAQQQICAALPFANLVELRLDLFDEFKLSELEQLQNQFTVPMIFTVRATHQGGNFTKPEDVRLQLIAELADLKPAYLDIEFSVPANSIKQIMAKHTEIKFIISQHNFIETPKNLDAIYNKMRTIPAWGYKLVTMPQHAVDCLRQLIWSKRIGGNIISLCMGPYGEISRILGPVIGNPITYAPFEQSLQTAAGQIPAPLLIERYGFHTLNPCTTLLALIGEPLTKSISAETHNRLFRALGWDAVYLKILLKKHELKEFLQLAKELPFSGFSITMPLKEYIIPLVDVLMQPDIGAINTLTLQNGRWVGSNSDGIGALNALEKLTDVAHKRLMIIGAGGAARAIAFEAVRRKAEVTLINRDESRARQVAKALNVKACGLNHMPLCAQKGYDILINCTPAAMPISEADILAHSIVMDINTKPKNTDFLIAARKKDCRLVYGYEMFIEQALEQFALWSEKDFSKEAARKILTQAALEIL